MIIQAALTVGIVVISDHKHLLGTVLESQSFPAGVGWAFKLLQIKAEPSMSPISKPFPFSRALERMWGWPLPFLKSEHDSFQMGLSCNSSLPSLSFALGLQMGSDWHWSHQMALLFDFLLYNWLAFPSCHVLFAFYREMRQWSYVGTALSQITLSVEQPCGKLHHPALTTFLWLHFSSKEMQLWGSNHC